MGAGRATLSRGRRHLTGRPRSVPPMRSIFGMDGDTDVSNTLKIAGTQVSLDRVCTDASGIASGKTRNAVMKSWLTRSCKSGTEIEHMLRSLSTDVGEWEAHPIQPRMTTFRIPDHNIVAGWTSPSVRTPGPEILCAFLPVGNQRTGGGAGGTRPAMERLSRVLDPTVPLVLLRGRPLDPGEKGRGELARRKGCKPSTSFVLERCLEVDRSDAPGHQT